jgi:hypothetical protein
VRISATAIRRRSYQVISLKLRTEPPIGIPGPTLSLEYLRLACRQRLSSSHSLVSILIYLTQFASTSTRFLAINPPEIVNLLSQSKMGEIQLSFTIFMVIITLNHQGFFITQKALLSLYPIKSSLLLQSMLPMLAQQIPSRSLIMDFAIQQHSLLNMSQFFHYQVSDKSASKSNLRKIRTEYQSKLILTTGPSGPTSILWLCIIIL